MNRTYRHVWSKAQGRWIVAAETARLRGAGGRGAGALLLAAVLAGATTTGWAQVVATGGNTAVYRAPNGVQVVDINTANAAGLSHNKYTEYNVDSKGLVLNNANPSTFVRPSVLAGSVAANVNLSTEARLILNEVVGNNRSLLAGFTEVVGGKADVVVANPWGITCDGCGFINTDRAVLSTGVPVIGAGGALEALRVTRGDVLVTGAGLDGNSLRLLDIVARSVKLDAKLQAKELAITAGANEWRPDGSSSAIGGDGAAPLFALDVAALGGMYANRIHLVATEAGVGVRMLGEAAASGDDFTLDAAGRVLVQGRLSAQRDLALRGGSGLTLDGGGSLAAGRDLALDSAGDALLADAALTATRDFKLHAASLDDRGNAAGTAVRAAGAALTATVGQHSTVQGARWTAGDTLTLDTGSLDIGSAGVTLAAGSDAAAATRSLQLTVRSGDVKLGHADLAAAGDVGVTAAGGGIEIDAGEHQRLAAGGDLRLQAATTLRNSTTIGAKRDLVIEAVAGTSALQLDNRGRLEAGRDLSGHGVAATNQAGATVLAGSALSLDGSTLTNYGIVQAAQAMRLDLNGSATNAAGGVLLVEGAGTLSLAAATLLNQGTVESRGEVLLAAGRLDNQGLLQSHGSLAARTDSLVNATGAKLMANAGVSLQARSAQGFSLNNLGLVQAGGTLEIGGPQGRAGVTNGGVLRGGDVSVSASAVQNDGVMHAARDQSIDAATLMNGATGGISALGTLSVSANAYLRNAGALYAGGDMTLSAVAGTLINTGAEATLDAGGAINATAYDLVNENAIRARDITLRGLNSFVNQPSGGLPTVLLSPTPLSASESTLVNQSYKCNIFGLACDEHQVYEQVAVYRQTLSRPLPANKPQVLATGTLSIRWGAGGGANLAGILSAQAINLSGSGSFVNQDFALDDITYAQRRVVKQIDCTICIENFTYYVATSEGQFNSPPGNDGQAITWGAGGLWTIASNTSYGGAFKQERGRSTYATSGAGIFAVSLSYSGGALINRGSPYGVSVSSRNGGSAESLQPTSGAALGGITVTLPANPNGYFVASKDPGAKYLVETNPLFQVDSGFVGSDYLAKRLGYNPDATLQRLGDANYEAQLIRQQLVAQTGRNLLTQAETEAQQMQRLMDNAATAASSAGLVYGQAPTAEQLAALSGDIVWMVETVVAGHKVLAPVVYLAQATRDALSAGGAAIEAENATIVAESLENTGGTIAAAGSLAVQTQGDITNTSGNIRGGDVSLTSKEGSIVNQTLATTRGDGLSAATTIGKAAGIQATNNLALDAKKDITIKGAELSAGGDASLAAGGNVTVDTIVDKSAATSTSSSGGLFNQQSASATVSSERNIGSALAIGGNLAIRAGGDTTLAGSSAKVGGELAVDTGGSFNVLARQDKTTVSVETSQSGLGVGGGVYGTTKTSSEDFTGTNVGSTLEVGGNAKVNAGKQMVIQGSNVAVGGDAALNAKDGIKILDGLDEQRSTSRTETTTFLKMDTDTDSSAEAKASKDSHGAKATAEAEGEASADFKLAETSVTHKASGSKSSVASTLQVGGNLAMKTEGTVTVQGSDVAAGGDLSVDAKRLEVLAGRNESYSSETTSTQSIGLYTEASGKASAEAAAGHDGLQGSAKAQAEASGEGTATAGVRTEASASTEYTLENRGSTLKSGGNMMLKAKEEAKFVGAEVEAGGDLSVEGKNITVLAAQDETRETSSSSKTTAGVYLGASAEASAEAGAEGNALMGQASAGAKAGVEVEASAGLRVGHESEQSTEGSVTNKTSSFKAGGNVSRKAQDTITDQGTQIEAGNNITQSARVIKEIEANDSEYETSSKTSHEGRMGVYAGANASASSDDGTETGASAGVKASYEGSTESESSKSTTAVTSKYKAGGSIDSTSTEKTTLIGTQFEAGKDVNLTAGSLDYQAAKDTSTKSSSKLDGAVEASVGLIGSAEVSVEASIEGERTSDKSSTARAGAINAGGALTIKTQGDATLEGTRLAGDGVAIDAGGNVDLKAARDTAESSSLGGSLGVSLGSDGAGLEASISASGESSSTAQAGSIQAGSGGVSIKSGGNTRLEGTQVDSGANTTVQAGGQVTLEAAQSSSVSYGISASGSLGASKDEETGKVEKSKDGSINASVSASTDSQAVSLSSKGKTTVVSNAKANAPAAKPAAKPAKKKQPAAAPVKAAPAKP